jgi:hypothetical protein
MPIHNWQGAVILHVDVLSYFTYDQHTRVACTLVEERGERESRQYIGFFSPENVFETEAEAKASLRDALISHRDATVDAINVRIEELS